MPEKKTVDAAKRDLRQGKRPTTAAGEFVKEEIDHIRAGKHGARSTKQAIAIGLSKARRSGVPLPSPKSGRSRRKAQQDLATGQGRRKPRTSSTRKSRATRGVLKRAPRGVASKRALSKQAKGAAARRRRTSSRGRRR